MPHLKPPGCPAEKSKKGFTLIEILIVVAIFAILATAAISTYVESTGTFDFLSNYKNVLSNIRTARIYALTNREAGGEVPGRYGVRISETDALVFADIGGESYFYEPQTPDTEEGHYDVLVKDFDLTATDYRIQAFDSSGTTALVFPLYIFYELGDGEVTVLENGADTVEKSEHKRIILRVYDSTGDLERHIVLFQASGLPEEYDNLPT